MKNLHWALVVATAAVMSAPASAAVSVGADQTFGTDNYRGTKASASLDLGESLYVMPTFSTYRADSSSGSYYQPGLRVGCDVGPLSLGVSGAFVPKNDGYRQNSVGADVTFSLAPGRTSHGRRMAGPASEGNETFGYGLAGVDLGGSVNHIQHSDDFTAAGASGDALRQKGFQRAKAFTVGQTDLTAFAGVKFLITEISASVSKSVYDKTLEGNLLRESPVMNAAGFTPVEAGFPDSDYNLKMKWKTLPVARPYVSFTHTNFKLGSRPSNAVEAGVTVGLDMLNLKGSYEHYSQTGFGSRNYFTLGAGLSFGA